MLLDIFNEETSLLIKKYIRIGKNNSLGNYIGDLMFLKRNPQEKFTILQKIMNAVLWEKNDKLLEFS